MSESTPTPEGVGESPIITYEAPTPDPLPQPERDEDIAKELKKLGWSDGKTEIVVLKYHNPTTEVWEYVVYFQFPTWKWDVVHPEWGGRGQDKTFKDVKEYAQGEYRQNTRWDFEHPVDLPPAEIAQLIDADRDEEYDNVSLEEATSYFGFIPVQRKAQRPNA